tara:strand:+ start:80 stop:538 length:459 start_codon:yes stop_codon:yes gene_type:complete
MIGLLAGTVYDSPKNILAIKNLNALNEHGVQSCLFCDIVERNFSVPVKTNALQRAQAFNFNGTIITQELPLVQDLKNIVYATKRYIYLYDMDWMRIKDLQFSHIRETLLHEDIDIVVRSDSHYEIVSRLFKTPVAIMKYWDVNLLKELDSNG